MKNSSWVRCLFLLAASCSALAQGGPQAANQQNPDNVALLKKSRAVYYSLKTEGMKQFTCSMNPNWTALLKTQGVNDPKVLDPAAAKLSQLHFKVDVNGDGNAKISHNEIPAENDQVAEGLKQIYGGMEQMTTGFFQTWSVFVINPPLPDPDTPIELETTPNQYRIKYLEGATRVGVDMGKDYSVTSVHASTADFDSVIRPRFTASGKGLLMNGYDASYQGTGGKDKTELQVALEYQDVSGMKVPRKLELKGSYNGASFAVEVVFDGCTASK